MALTNAERQQRYRDRRKEQQPRVRYRRPQDRRSRPQRWADAVATFLELQAAYQEWFDNLPANLHDTPLAEKLEAVWAFSVKRRNFGRSYGPEWHHTVALPTPPWPLSPPLQRR